MPSTYLDCLSRINLLLGEPHPNAPSEPVRWRYLADSAQLLFNQAMNSPPSWATQSIDVDVLPGQPDGEYQLGAPNFGKDILVHSIDPSDPNHVETPVRRMSLQSSLLGGNDGYVRQSSGSLAGLKHTVQTFVFYRKAGAVYFKTLPADVPQQASYRIWYQEAEPATDSDGNSFILPAGIPYLCAYTAAMLLPLTKWCGLTAEENRQARKEFGTTLGDMVKAQEREWRKFIATDRKAGLTVMRGFDDESYAADLGWE
jgi:hypothetical protein